MQLDKCGVHMHAWDNYILYWSMILLNLLDLHMALCIDARVVCKRAVLSLSVEKLPFLFLACCIDSYLQHHVQGRKRLNSTNVINVVPKFLFVCCTVYWLMNYFNLCWLFFSSLKFCQFCLHVFCSSDFRHKNVQDCLSSLKLYLFILFICKTERHIVGET